MVLPPHGKGEADQTKQNHYFVADTEEGIAATWKVGGMAADYFF